MISTIRQMAALSRATLLSLPRRMAISLSMVLSIMLVVCVLSGFLAMARGFETTLQGAGSPDVAIILGGGAREEVNSEISLDTVRSILAMERDIGVERDETGAPLVSRESVVPVEYRTQPGELGDTLTLRGMDASGARIRKGIEMASGRIMAPGSREIVVGLQLARQYPGFDIGDQVRLGPVEWTVAGHFSARGSVFESEIWGSFDAVNSAFDRVGDVQSLRVRLSDTSGMTKLENAMSGLHDRQLTVLSEADLYAGQSEETARLIRLFGWPLAILMAVGATAGALNTMMSSLSERSLEIATVRALGFGRLSASFATWLEAFILSALGAALGVATAWFAYNGWQASTLGANGTRIAFELVFDARAAATAATLGVAIGIVGGLVPAWAAARLPVISAIQARG